jgi:hypothetical protein
MKERPMLFSAPMVRALLDGSKTQTRRVVKHRWPHMWQEPYYATGKVLAELPTQPGAFMEFRTRRQDDPSYQGSTASFLVPCPYGQPGDRLWVRETHAPQADCWGSWERWLRGAGGEPPIIHYAADFKPFQNDNGFMIRKPFIEKWRPSIHMPRWASRIDLEVTGVRVERLQEISEADAWAEGVSACTVDASVTGRDRYRVLWEQINGAGSWSLDPWVWIIEFKQPAAVAGEIGTPRRARALLALAGAEPTP